MHFPSRVVGGIGVSILLLVLATIAVRADEPTDDIDDAIIIPGDTFYYTGTIGKRLPIQLSLCIVSESLAGKPFRPGQGQPVRGSYFYESIGTLITLRGTLYDSTLEITEWLDGKTTGRFAGRFDHAHAQQHLKWHSPDGRRVLEVELSLIARSTRVQREEDAIWICEEWPVLLGDDSLARGVNARLAEDAERFVSASMADARRMDEENGPGLRGAPWRDHRRTALLYFSPTLISLEVVQQNYTGGAHSNYEYDGRCFVLRDGHPKEIRLEDLSRSRAEFIRWICELCEADLKRQGASALTMSLDRKLSRDDIGGVQIRPSGLTVVFNPYAVGCFAEGGYFVEIPWRMVVDRLRENLEIHELAKKYEKVVDATMGPKGGACD